MSNTDTWNAYNSKAAANIIDPKSSTKLLDEYTIILVRANNNKIMDEIDGRINMIADGGFCMGKGNFIAYITRTDTQTNDLRDRLMKGYYTNELEVIVLKVNCNEISALVAEPLRSYVKKTFNIK